MSRGGTCQIFATWGDYIKAETLTTNVVAGEPAEGAYQETQKVEGEELLVGVKRN